MKAVNITFDYDPETDTIKNVKCEVEGVKKTKAKSKASLVTDKAEVVREDNKLLFSTKALELLQVNPDSRVIIKYEKDKNAIFPVIGTDTAFDEEGEGNKISKSSTMAFRGHANTILSEYGTTFSVVEYKDGIFKLVDEEHSIENISDEALNKLAENEEASLIVEDGFENISDELEEQLNIGNLKFELK